mgnify:CR=1 FL=1
MIKTIESTATTRQLRIIRIERRTLEAIVDVPLDAVNDDFEEIASLAQCSGMMLVTESDVLDQTIEDADSTAGSDVQRHEAFDTPCDECWQGELPVHFLAAQFHGKGPGWEVESLSQNLDGAFGLERCTPRQLRDLLHNEVVWRSSLIGRDKLDFHRINVRMEDGVVRPAVVYRCDDFSVILAVAPDGARLGTFPNGRCGVWEGDLVYFDKIDLKSTVLMSGPWFVEDVISDLMDAGLPLTDLYLDDECVVADGDAMWSGAVTQLPLPNRIEPFHEQGLLNVERYWAL